MKSLVASVLLLAFLLEVEGHYYNYKLARAKDHLLKKHAILKDKVKSIDPCPKVVCKQLLIPVECRLKTYFYKKGVKCRGCDNNKCSKKVMDLLATKKLEEKVRGTGIPLKKKVLVDKPVKTIKTVETLSGEKASLLIKSIDILEKALSKLDLTGPKSPKKIKIVGEPPVNKLSVDKPAQKVIKIDNKSRKERLPLPKKKSQKKPSNISADKKNKMVDDLVNSILPRAPDLQIAKPFGQSDLGPMFSEGPNEIFRPEMNEPISPIAPLGPSPPRPEQLDQVPPRDRDFFDKMKFDNNNIDLLLPPPDSTVPGFPGESSGPASAGLTGQNMGPQATIANLRAQQAEINFQLQQLTGEPQFPQQPNQMPPWPPGEGFGPLSGMNPNPFMNGMNSGVPFGAPNNLMMNNFVPGPMNQNQLMQSINQNMMGQNFPAAIPLSGFNPNSPVPPSMQGNMWGNNGPQSNFLGPQPLGINQGPMSNMMGQPQNPAFGRGAPGGNMMGPSLGAGGSMNVGGFVGQNNMVGQQPMASNSWATDPGFVNNAMPTAGQFGVAQNNVFPTDPLTVTNQGAANSLHGPVGK